MSDSLGGQLTKAHGAVKWFDVKKGFGFIVGPEGQDVFVHFSKIEGGGFRALRDGAEVEYDAVLTAKGWQATRVARPPAPVKPAALAVTVRPADRRTRSPRR